MNLITKQLDIMVEFYHQMVLFCHIWTPKLLHHKSTFLNSSLKKGIIYQPFIAIIWMFLHTPVDVGVQEHSCVCGKLG